MSESVHSERYEQGWEALTRINQTTDPRVIRELETWAPDIARAIVEFGYGETYARSEHLPDRDRQLATVSSLVAMGGCESQLEIHLTAALKIGITPPELTELMLHLVAFCGFPRVLNALTVLKTVFDRQAGRQ